VFYFDKPSTYNVTSSRAYHYVNASTGENISAIEAFNATGAPISGKVESVNTNPVKGQNVIKAIVSGSHGKTAKLHFNNLQSSHYYIVKKDGIIKKVSTSDSKGKLDYALGLSTHTVVLKSGNLVSTPISRGSLINLEDSTTSYYAKQSLPVGKPTVVYSDHIKAGTVGIWIQGTAAPRVELTKLKPNASNNEGETFFEASIMGQEQTLNFKFTGLAPNRDYTVYKDNRVLDTYRTDSDGVLKFEASLGSEHSFSVAMEKKPQAVMPPVPSQKGFPVSKLLQLLSILLAFGAVAGAYYYYKQESKGGKLR